MDDDSVKKFVYLGLGSHFTIPAHHHFSNAPAGVAHTRCLTFLKPLTGGPYFDLEAIWDEHTKFEFGERAVEKTMGTMGQLFAHNRLLRRPLRSDLDLGHHFFICLHLTSARALRKPHPDHGWWDWTRTSYELLSASLHLQQPRRYSVAACQPNRWHR